MLKQINYTASVAIATGGNFTLARAGQRIATIKSTPFAVSAEQLDTVLELLRERGPLLQARPVRRPELAVVYCDPQDPARARAPYEPITQQRLARLGCEVRHSVQALETEEDLARCLDSLLRLRPTGILVASTTSPAGPTDAVGRAMTRVGCLIERFLAPVEPGTLFLMGYQGETPIVSAPGCFRSAKPNILDLVLPPILSRYRLSGWEVAALGAGGLLA